MLPSPSLVCQQAPVTMGCFTSAQLRYFKTSNGSIATSPGHWEDISSMEQLPKYHKFYKLSRANLIVVDNTLYAKATYSSRHTVLYRYHATNNVWDRVCERQGGHLNVVHLNSYFYFIEMNSGDVVRFDTKNMSWESIERIPQPCYNYAFMTSYCSMLLVYGQVAGPAGHKLQEKGDAAVYRLQVYEPKYNLWTQADESDILCPDEDRVSPPILMQHNWTCYRIMFKWQYIRMPNKGFVQMIHLPIVQEIVFHEDVTGMLTVELGEEMPQDEVPTDIFGAFQIEGDIFVSCRGLFILKMGEGVLEEVLNEKANHKIWERLGHYAGSNVVSFTFDQELVKQ